MNPKVRAVFDHYPAAAQKQLLKIREAVYAVANKEGLGPIEETLKWGEPSYIVKGGSTIRIDWKTKTPEQFYVFFNCKTRLVETFHELYGDLFLLRDNRAMVFNINDKIPITELKQCLSMALRYHSIKHLPLLGA